MKKKNSISFGSVLFIFLIALILFGKISDGGPLILSLIKWAISLIIIVCIAFVGLLFFAVHLFRSDDKKAEKKKPGNNDQAKPADQTAAEVKLSEQDDEVIEKCRNLLKGIRSRGMAVKNTEVRNKLVGIYSRGDKIIKTLCQKPEKINDSRQFWNYYLPTLKNVLTKYLSLQNAGTLSDDMIDKTSAFLTQVDQALERLHKNLYDQEQLDLSVDMEAMKISLQRDGLI